MTIKIEYICFLNQSGYSIAAQNLILALSKYGNYDIRLHVFGGRPARPAVSDEKYEFFIKMTKKERDPDAIQIYHCIPTLQKRIDKLKKNLGFATFETFEPPDDWLKVLNQNDALIVPSKFNYDVFAHAKVKKPIFYIPHCLDFDLYNKDVMPIKKYDGFTFLFMGTWKKRKGYVQLLEAWFTEFTDKDGVNLVIKTDKPQSAETYVKQAKKELGITKGFAPIFFERKVFDETTLPRYIKSFDCLISPTAGEGFYLPGLQCMSLGVPVIISNFSGCKDYANDKTATLLEPRGYILHNNMDRIPQFINKKWVFITVKDIKESMRYVLNNPQVVKEKADNAYTCVREKFNYQRIERLFTEMIGQLY